MKSVREFGAVGDGWTKDTTAIQEGIETLARQGGGRLLFPAGTYLTGTLYLKSNVFLDLEPGAVILGSPDPADYNADDFCPQNRVFASEHVSGAHLITAVGEHNVGIVGGGRIDGNRQAFYNEQREDVPWLFKLTEWRPGQMIFLCECKNVTITGVELYNTCYWTCFLHGCQDVTISDLRIWNDQRTPNGDGIDLDCCQRVNVTNCNIDSGDDCITLRGCVDPLLEPRACEQVTISNCVLRTRCNAFRIGVGTGIVRNCTISNIVFWGTRTAVAINSRYTPASAGVTIENIQFENLRMDCKRPIVITSYVRGVCDEESKLIRNISFRHITGRATHSSLILGNTDRQVKNISICDVDMDYWGGADNADDGQYHRYGEWSTPRSAPNAFYAENVDGITFRDVFVNVDGADASRWEAKFRLVNCREGRAAAKEL